MLQNHFIRKSPNLPDNIGKHEQLEPEYAPDWLAIEQKAMMLRDYWQLVCELARIEQVLENFEERRYP